MLSRQLGPLIFIHSLASRRATVRGGFSGDEQPALNAEVGPSALVVDAAIRKVDTNGIIHTVAGNGGALFSGDGGPAVDAQVTPDPLGGGGVLR